jgi:hypothetical protein
MKSGSFQNSGNQPTQPEWLKRPFTLSDDCGTDDSLIRVIMDEDLKGLDTPLGLMKRYADQLNQATSHGDIDEKLDKLFLSGRTPAPLDGYYHGITISLKTGTDAQDKLSRICSVFDSDGIDPLQIIYGTTSIRRSADSQLVKSEKRLLIQPLRALVSASRTVLSVVSKSPI